VKLWTALFYLVRLLAVRAKEEEEIRVIPFFDENISPVHATVVEVIVGVEEEGRKRLAESHAE